MRFYSGEINKPELEAILITRYADSMKKNNHYWCGYYTDFACNGQLCRDCDFNNESMKARHDKVMIALGRMEAPRVNTSRIPEKRDKQYKLTLKKLRGTI